MSRSLKTTHPETQRGTCRTGPPAGGRSRLRSGLLRSAARFIAARRGAAIIEFAYVSPGLLFALLGATEFGYLLWNRHSLEFAVEESARMVLTKQTITDADIITDIKSRIINLDASAVTATVDRETIGVTTFVTLNVNYAYGFLFGGYFGLDPIQLSTKTRVPLRQSD